MRAFLTSGDGRSLIFGLSGFALTALIRLYPTVLALAA